MTITMTTAGTTSFTPTMTTTRKPLIAGVLRGTLKAPATTGARPHGFSPDERERVRNAMDEGRDVRDRTVDHVVDRLLTELTW